MIASRHPRRRGRWPPCSDEDAAAERITRRGGCKTTTHVGCPRLFPIAAAAAADDDDDGDGHDREEIGCENDNRLATHSL